jgi:dolichol-phosphate mannosyltransferase
MAPVMDMADMKKVLVILPTYNEAQNIEQVVTAIEHVAQRSHRYAYSLLIVDDRSPDGTAQKVKLLQKRYDNIHLLSGEKAGLGNAYIRGFQYALKKLDAYDSFVMMDADLSHNPDDIPTLLRILYRGSDYVIGSRYASGGAIPGSWSLVRIVNSRVANFVARKLVGIADGVNDVTGGFKAIRREALEKIDLSSLNVKGYIFQVSLLHAFLSHGFQVTEVPITFANRQYGTSKMKMHDIIEFLYRAYKLNPDAPIQRLVRFGVVGACGTVVNLVILTFLVKLLHTEVLFSDAIAIEASIIFNFFLNHYYTFKGYGSNPIRTRKESIHTFLVKMGTFNIGALGGATISFTTFTILFKLVHMNYALADVIAILIAMSWNYWMSTHFVWRVVDEEVI